MPIYRRQLKKGLRWYYSGQYLSQKYHSKAIYLTKKECRKAESLKIQELDKRARKPKDILLWDLINERLDYIQLKNSKAYYSESKRYFSVLYKSLGNQNLSEIRKSEINSLIIRFASDLKKRGISYHQANALLRAIKALFNYGIKMHELDVKNPCIGINLYSVDHKFKHIPSDEDIQALISICDPKQARLVRFVKATGARVNEPLSMTFKDVFDDYVVLYTRKSKNSNLSPRKVPKPECLKGLKGKPNERVFSTWENKPKFLYKKVRKLNQTIWGWHNLRHRYASKLSKEGRPIFEIMALLGHQNLTTTQKYLQLLP